MRESLLPSGPRDIIGADLSKLAILVPPEKTGPFAVGLGPSVKPDQLLRLSSHDGAQGPRTIVLVHTRTWCGIHDSRQPGEAVQDYRPWLLRPMSQVESRSGATPSSGCYCIVRTPRWHPHTQFPPRPWLLFPSTQTPGPRKLPGAPPGGPHAPVVSWRARVPWERDSDVRPSALSRIRLRTRSVRGYEIIRIRTVIQYSSFVAIQGHARTTESWTPGALVGK